jgi:hypothetical protein
VSPAETPTRPCAPPQTEKQSRARRYWDAIKAEAKRRPALPMDHSEPEQWRCCIVPPAMTGAT